MQFYKQGSDMFYSCVVRFIFSGIGLRQTVREQLNAAGATRVTSKELDDLCGNLILSKSESTSKKYNYSFNAWKRYCETNNYSSLPGSPIIVALYLSGLLTTTGSYHTVTSAFYGIKWAHHMNGLSDPTENSFVRNILESAKRTAKAPCRKKDAVTSDHIIQLCDNFIDSQDLCTVRNLCMITLAYAGFLRFDELSSIRCKDLTFCDNYVDISIPKSKTDQYRHGCNILISKGSTSACPVDMLKRYINLANLNIRSDSLLFKAVNKSKSGSKLISKDKKLSYTRSKECVVSMFKIVDPNLKVGLHSLRSGGASTAANNKIYKVSERCLKRHGRWKTDFAKDSYIDDSPSKRLKVSQSLGL